jgi:hypothetical protein
MLYVFFSTNGAVLISITIPVIQMFCPLMEQYVLVLPFLSYRCSVVGKKTYNMNGNTSEYCFISGRKTSVQEEL